MGDKLVMKPLLASSPSTSPHPPADERQRSTTEEPLVLEITTYLEEGNHSKLRDYLQGCPNSAIFLQQINSELVKAIRLDQSECLRVLLDFGGDPNHVDAFHTMLEYANKWKRRDIFTILCESGAELVYEVALVKDLLTLMKTFKGVTRFLIRFDMVADPLSDLRRGPSTIQMTDKVEMWRLILQNDDVKLLARLHNTWIQQQKVGSTSEVALSFDACLCELTNKELWTLLSDKCKENGLGVLTAVADYFKDELKDKDFLAIVKSVTKLPSVLLKVEEVPILPAFHNSVLLLTLLTGRLNVLEKLVRMRQFDLVPTALFVCLFSRRLLSQLRQLPNQAKLRLNDIASTMEHIAADGLNRLSLLDNSIVLGMLQDPLETTDEDDKIHELSLMDVAHRAGCSSFLSLPSCQSVLKARFCGSRVHVEHSDVKCSKATIVFNALTSPRCKYITHSIFHIAFLVCLSCILLWNFYESPSGWEYVCCVYVVGLAVEFIRKVLTQHGTATFRTLDICFEGAVIFFVALPGFVWRLVILQLHWSDKSFFGCRICLLLALLLLYMRVLDMLTIWPALGPRLIMMKNMFFKDLAPLVSMFILFCLSFGVVIQSLLYPNGQQRPNSANMSRSGGFYIFRRTFYGMFAAEYPLEELKCDDASKDPCPDERGSDLVLFLFHAAFVFAVNICLINLLIALFSNTVADIGADSRSHWLAQRYHLVHDYQRRSCAPPPFNIFSCIYDLIKYWYLLSKKAAIPDDEDNPQEKDSTMMTRFLVAQAFALRNQRYNLGEARGDAKMKQLENELREFRREFQSWMERSGGSAAAK